MCAEKNIVPVSATKNGILVCLYAIVRLVRSPLGGARNYRTYDGHRPNIPIYYNVAPPTIKLNQNNREQSTLSIQPQQLPAQQVDQHVHQRGVLHTDPPPHVRPAGIIHAGQHNRHELLERLAAADGGLRRTDDLQGPDAGPDAAHTGAKFDGQR